MGVLKGALIVVGLLLMLYMVWVAATSKTFLAVSVTLLMAATVAVVFAAAILGVARLIPWWEALILTVAGSAVFLLALVPTARFGLSRIERSLKAEYPDHWNDGESAVKSEVERLTRLPETAADANLLQSQLLRLAAKGHAQRYPHDSADGTCLAFDMAFTGRYLESLKAAGFEAKRSQTPGPSTTDPGA
jgi:hypothetical protein